MPDNTVSVMETQMRDRLKELEPLVEEHTRIERALAAFEGSSAKSAPRRRRAPRDPNHDTHKLALQAIRDAGEDGISIANIAAEAGVTPPYTYKIVGDLEDDGNVEKRGMLVYPLDEQKDEDIEPTKAKNGKVTQMADEPPTRD